MTRLVLPMALAVLTSATTAYTPQPERLAIYQAPPIVRVIPGVPPQYQALFAACEAETGFPAEVVGLLVGNAENCKWDPLARSKIRADGTYDRGLFQHASNLVEYFAWKYNGGKPYDPDKPEEAAIVTFRMLADNLRQFNGDMRLTIASYKQGVCGVREDGPLAWYVDRVFGEDGR